MRKASAIKLLKKWHDEDSAYAAGKAEGRRLERRALLRIAKRHAVDASAIEISSGDWVNVAALSARSKRGRRKG